MTRREAEGLSRAWIFPGIAAALSAFLVVSQRGGVVLPAVLVVCVAAMFRARRFVLAMTAVSLVVGSTVHPSLKASVFYLRFVMLIGLVAVTLIKPRAAPRQRAITDLGVPVALFVTLAFASATWSVDPGLTLQRAASVALLFMAVFALAARAWATRQDVLRDLAVVAFVLVAALIVGLVGYARGAEWASQASRFRGILENPNSVGVVGALLIPVAFGFAGWRRGGRRMWWSVVGLLALVSLVLSESRSGLIGAGLGLLTILMVGSRRSAAQRSIPFVIVGLSIAVLLIGVSRAPDRLQDAAGRRIEFESGAGGRFDAWRLAWDLCRDRPGTGWGFGTTEQVFGVRVPALVSQTFQGGLVHNGYLQTLLEIGPMGLVLLISALWRIVRRAIGGSLDVARSGVIGAVVAGLVSQMGESGITSAGSIFAFNFWLLAIAALSLRLRPEMDLTKTEVPVERALAPQPSGAMV